MSRGIYDETYRRDFEEGYAVGIRETVLAQLQEKFGPISAAIQDLLRPMTAEQLIELAVALLKANSLQDLGLADLHISFRKCAGR